MGMSQRGGVAKGLPRALANLGPDDLITHPYNKGRVLAHDRGRDAGKLIAMAGRREQKVKAHRKPLRSHNPLTAPFSIARDEADRFYGMQGVRDTRARAARVVSQGRAGREFSRDQIGKSMRLSEVGKQSSVSKAMSREDKKATATGAGAVGVGAGLLGGGIPGRTATRLTADVMRAPLHKKPIELLRARQAGAFGLRETGHKILRNVVLKPKVDAASGPSSSSRFRRGLNTGKIASEDKIIGHLRRGKIASNVALVGGAGALAYGMTGRKKEPVKKARSDQDRRDTAVMGAGGTVAAGSYGAGRLLRSQSRKWSRQSSAALNEADRILPGAGAHTVGRKYGEPVVRPTMDNKQINSRVLRGTSKTNVERLGHLRGRAGQAKYFANVYGAFGMGLRRGAAPAGLGAVALGHHRKSKRQQQAMAKAYRPGYFNASAPTERLSGENQRYRTEVQHQAARGAAVALGAGSTAALGARWAGHKRAPEAIKAGAAVARAKGVPKEVVSEASAKANRLHRWATPRRGRLLAASALASGGAVGANTVARWKRDEVTGIGQDLGRASAGDRGIRHAGRVTKSAATAIGIEAATKGGQKLATLSPETRKQLYRGAIIGTAGTSGAVGTGWAVSRNRRIKRENAALRASGPVMKAETVGFGKAHGGSNIREYDYLPENIRNDVGQGSIGVRRNPMSALDLFASSRIMAQSAAAARGEKVSRGRLSRRAHNEMAYAGSRAMLYSPTGRGSVF
jgi:hypothetical protein